MKTQTITARDYIFDYIHLISLACPEEYLYAETLIPLEKAERIELMENIVMLNKITYFGIMREMTPKNMLTDYEWILIDAAESLDEDGGI